MKIHTRQHSAAYWRVTIDNPPVNFFDQEMADEMQAVLSRLEADSAVKVVVFESANPDFFIAPADFESTSGSEEELQPTVRAALHSLLKRLNRSQFLTVGVLRGHARGVGSEFLLGLDVRFASSEKAVLSQIDLGTEFSDIKDGFERLCDLVGRARALEIILGSEDLDAAAAERLSLINRSIPHQRLDEFVARFAANISNFDREYIALFKQLNGERAGLANVFEMRETPDKFFEALKWSDLQERVASPVERVWHEQGSRDFPLGEEFRPDYDL